MKEFDEIIKKLEADIEEYKKRNEMLSNEVNKHIKEGIEKDVEIKEQNDDVIWLANRFNAVERDNRKLKEENERLKELCDKYEEEHKTTFEQWQEDIKRNKKAIEYIENCSGTYKNFIGERNSMIKSVAVLKILKGSDKE